MKNNLLMKLIKCSILGLLFYLLGCLSQIASIEESAPTWIGRPIIDRQNMMFRPGDYPSKIGWKEKTYRLENGNMVYVEPAGPDCFIRWEVNPEGIIVGYRTEGSRCW